MRMFTRKIATAIALALLAGTAITAADLNKSIADTESRRRAAESGLKQIKTKSATDAQKVHVAYDEAAKQHNAWLAAVSQGIEQAGSTAPNVDSVSGEAALAFVAWVAARNRALGEFELAGAAAEAVKKKVVMDLSDIAAAGWRNNRQRDAGRKSAFTKSLNERLSWKTWDQVQ